MGNRRKSTDAVRDVQEFKLVSESSLKKLVADAIKDRESQQEVEINALKAEILEIKASQEFLSSQYDNLKAENDSLRQANEKQEKELKKLNDQSLKCEDRGVHEVEKVDAIEQYGRRQNLEIAGVKVSDNEDTNKIAIEVAKIMNVDLSPDQISTSHRLSAKRKRNNNDQDAPPPSIIVRFISRDVRNQIYSNRKLLRKADLSKFSVENTTAIFVNENLTQTRKRLFWKAKQRVKEHQYKYIWTTNGNVFVKKSDEANLLMIKNELDLDLIC